MTVKEYLHQAYRLDQRIKSDTIEAQNLREMAGSVSAIQYDKDRVQTSRNAVSSILVSLLLANLCHLLSELLIGCGNLAAFVVGKNTFALCGSFHRTDRMWYLGIKYLDFLTVCTFDRCRNFLRNVGTGHYHSH